MTTDIEIGHGKADGYAERFSSSEKMFIVDPAKHRVISALITYLMKNKTNSFLAVTPDTVTARELAARLKKCLKDIYVVDSTAKLDELYKAVALAGIDEHDDDSRKIGVRIMKKSFPNLIIALGTGENGEYPFLNKTLFPDKSLGGNIMRYQNISHDYAIQDLLADAEYDFVYLDEIYRLFAFTKCTNAGKFSVDSIDPFKYDIMYFNHDAYYIPRVKSYKRLEKLADSAGRLLVYTDSLTAGNAINLYAAKKLTDNPGLIKLSHTINDYITEQNAEILNYQIITLSDLENAGRIMDISGSRFNDVEELKNRIDNVFRSMTKREIFLRFVRVYAKMRGVALTDSKWFDNMIEFIADSDRDDFARCVYNMLFSDETETRVAEAVSAENMTELVNEFGGIAYRLSPVDFDVVRSRRLDSSFEYVLEKRYGSVTKRDNDTVFTSVGVGQSNCRYNKYLAAFRTICSKEEYGKSFMIVVSRDALQEAKDSVKDIAEKFGYRYLDNASELLGDSLADEAVVFVTDIQHFAATPYDYGVLTVYFADEHPAVRFFTGLMDKAKRMRFSPKIILAATRDDFSAIIVEKYINKQCDFNSLTDKNENLNGAYSLSVRKLEAAYVAARKLVEGTTTCGDSAANFKKYLDDLNDQNVFSGEAAFRLSEFEKVGKCFGKVYANSITFEDGGDSIDDVDLPKVEKPRIKKNMPHGVKSGSSRYVFFDTCIKYVRGMCPPPANCADCSNYEKLKFNDAQCFFRSITKEFYPTIKEYAKKYREYAENVAAGMDIHSESSEKSFEKTIIETDTVINKSEREINSIITTMKNKRASAASQMFHVEYDKVEKIKSMLYDVFNTVFGDLFDFLFESMEKEMADGAASFENIKDKVS